MLQEEYRYWLANLPNIGVRKIDQLLHIFGSAREIYHAPGRMLYALKKDGALKQFSEQDVETIAAGRNAEKVQMEYAKLQKDSIYFVSREEEEYPGKLIPIFDAPYALYYKGRLPGSQEKLLAVVGARECSPYGIETAKYLAAAIAKAGIGVVSGLARGIDSCAHTGAVSAGGITYAVLGCGIDICYPRENINLYMELQQEGGIISEYPPGTAPAAGNFPMRNRIISGLSDGILIIEAKEKSGSLITIDYGLDQGKEIYALPGRATDRLSAGCNNLIKMGAKLVTTPKDILEDFLPNYEQTMDELKKNNKLLETAGKIVYASLCLEPKHIEEIAESTGLGIDSLMEQLLLLELQGLIKQPMKNYYCT